jgi:hypothetical protein
MVDIPPAANEFPTKTLVGALPFSSRNEPIMVAIAFRSLSSSSHT